MLRVLRVPWGLRASVSAVDTDFTGTERVAPGVERLALCTPTLPPATHTNCYLLGETDFYVVEPASPYPAEQKSLRAAVQGTVVGGGYQQYPQQQQQYYRPQQNYGGAYVGGGGGVATPVGSVNGAVRMGVPIP